MIGRYRKSQEGGRSRFYLLLSFIFVVIVIKWGFPLFIKIIAGKGSEVSKSIDDIIPPQPPVLSATTNATNEASFSIDGFTEPDAEVELMINDILNKKDKAKSDGFFSFSSGLSDGSNRVQVRAVDSSGNSSLSIIKIITVDREPIILTINSPKDGTEYIGKNSQSVEITGKTSKPNAQVIANGSFVDVNKDGTFIHKLLLNNGENILKIIASDNAGNTDEKSVKITYSP